MPTTLPQFVVSYEHPGIFERIFGIMARAIGIEVDPEMLTACEQLALGCMSLLCIPDTLPGETCVSSHGGLVRFEHDGGSVVINTNTKEIELTHPNPEMVRRAKCAWAISHQAPGVIDARGLATQRPRVIPTP